MCNYAFSSFETEAEMTGFTTFHFREDSGSFFPLAGFYTEGTTVPGVIAESWGGPALHGASVET